MQVGDRVFLHSHDGFRREVFIKESGLPSPSNDGLTCYKTNEGSVFYMRPEVGTGRYYNIGDRAFWLTRAKKNSEEIEQSEYERLGWYAAMASDAIRASGVQISVGRYDENPSEPQRYEIFFEKRGESHSQVLASQESALLLGGIERLTRVMNL